MSEQAQTPSPGANPKPIGGSGAPPSDTSKFSFGNLEFPKFEIPAQFRDFAERNASQAKETCERMKSTNDELTDRLKESYATASRRANEYGLLLMEGSRAHVNSAFGYATKLISAKSLSELIELTSAHTREQPDVLAEQSKKLTVLAQKVASEAAEPIKEGITQCPKAGGLKHERRV